MLKPIYVTEPFLPPLDELSPLLEKIWGSKQITNNGPYAQEFERKLEEYLGVEHVTLVANGTLGLIAALQALEIEGEVITTPYSFVATSNAIDWNKCQPVFVDIEKDSFNLDPAKIEAAITDNTRAIMPVHVYGRSCNVDAIKKIADKHNLKIIYDAAHAFGVFDQGKSLIRHGDVSVVSMHATKVMNTFEGGFVVSKDKKIKERLEHLRNFGFVNQTTVVAPGINCKMNEFQSAVGIVQLNYIDDCIHKRHVIDMRYRQALAAIDGLLVPELSLSDVTYNYCYFPVLVEDDFSLTRDQLHEGLKLSNVFSRRYFYPLISDFPMFNTLNSASKKNLPNATRISNKILCLPIYPDLTEEDQGRVISAIIKLSKSSR